MNVTALLLFLTCGKSRKGLLSGSRFESTGRRGGALSPTAHKMLKQTGGSSYGGAAISHFFVRREKIRGEN
jgi:hypothetical protein